MTDPVVQDNKKTLTSQASLLWAAFIAGILGALYFISTVNYLLFHGIVEIAGIAVAFSIFTIVWNTRREITDGFFLIIGISFLFFGTIDLVHTLAYKGMGIIPGNSSDLPTQLWIAARYFQSITFLIATFFIGRSITRERKYDTGIILAACTTVTALIFASIFVWKNFPQCFIDGSGLTPFKIGSEYVISLILISTIVILYRKREHFDPGVWQLLIAAQAFLVLGELAFTSYISVYGFMNMLGHLFRLLSVYLFYRVFVVIALTRPYDLLLRELKKDEDALRESENKLNTIVRGSPIPQFVIDSSHRVIHWNAALEIYSGIKAGEVIGTNQQWRAFYPFERPCMADLLADATIEKIPEWYEGKYAKSTLVEGAYEATDFFPRMGPSGIWLHFTAAPIRDLEGRVIGVVETLEDITGRKQVEEEIRKARDFYLKVLDDFPNPIWRADTHAKCDYFNRDWLEFTGRRLEQELGDGWAEGVHPDDFDRCLKIYLDNFHARTAFEMEYRLRYHDGTYHWLVDSGKPFYTQDGEFAGYIGSCYDVQGRKLAEEALRQANSKLNLLSSITRHDINNQLFTLKAFLELSKQSLDDPAKTSEYIIKEERAVDAIERQIVFTREYQDLGVKSPAWQDVEDGVRKAMATLTIRDIRVIADIAGLEVYADPLLEKVFYNLIDNALRYGGTRMTEIRISSSVTEAGLVITVEDDGAGIPERDKKQIFERGFGHNTGLGLFLSREILAITGITIAENGEPGKGARFGILVPKEGYRFISRS